jgi:hypothetical protein
MDSLVMISFNDVKQIVDEICTMLCAQGGEVMELAQARLRIKSLLSRSQQQQLR